jgi:hypothetical protein
MAFFGKGGFSNNSRSLVTCHVLGIISASPEFIYLPQLQYISSAQQTCANAAFHMFSVSVLRYALFVLVPLSIISSTYLYLYPIFHLCAFPAPEQDVRSSYYKTVQQHALPLKQPTKIAPFRLLALGDPQLEGDSSIPDPKAATFPNLHKFWKDALLLDGTKHNPLQRLRHSLHDVIDFYLDDIPKALEFYRKKIDHVGNDYYLGHIYRTLYWWTRPTHVTVLGDLVGSQWIDDAEFESRGWRFWERVFRHGGRVSDDIASSPSQDFKHTRVLGDDAEGWKRRIINVAGNHDIGYAGDLSKERMERFERVFGKANYELRFQLPVNNLSANVEEGQGQEKPAPELRIVVLNDMNLDTPASSKELQDETYQFLNNIITTSKDVTRPAHFTLVLTHIPLHKEAGVCVDAPFFDFFSGDFSDGVKEQNHLSGDASKGFLEGIFGMSGDSYVPGQGLGRHGLILTGHDHEGCDTYHFINQSAPPERRWEARRYQAAQASGLLEEAGVPGMREITVRSMMGEFAGNAGLISLWFDEESWDWQFEFANCSMGKQHIWWVVHIVDLITIGIIITYCITEILQNLGVLEAKAGVPIITGNGTAMIPNTKRVVKDDVKDAELVQYLSANGKLDVPGAGKKSLRKKRSKRNLNGNSNGSPSPTI